MYRINIEIMDRSDCTIRFTLVNFLSKGVPPEKILRGWRDMKIPTNIITTVKVFTGMLI